MGQNVFNPAMVARVALLVSFPVPLTQWVLPMSLASVPAPDFLQGLHIFVTSAPPLDGIASASLLGHTKTEMSRGIDLLQSLAAANAPALSWFGTRAGSLGESASLLILAGGLYLLATGTGLGNLLNQSRGYLDYGMIWTVAAVSVCLSVACYYAVLFVERRTLTRLGMQTVE